MRRTAWSIAAGSVPSDRLRPAQRPQHAPQKQNKGKGKTQEPLKSQAVRKLQSLAEGIQKSSGRDKDPKGGCFCQGEALTLLLWFITLRTAEMPLSNPAREHDLSLYTPICRDCGLILCAINL